MKYASLLNTANPKRGYKTLLKEGINSLLEKSKY